MKKRKQHYVWRHYLSAWANHNDQIWCCRENSIFNTNLMNIGQERDFYKIKKLDYDDINFIRRIIQKNPNDHLQEVNMGWLKIFTSIFELEDSLNESKLDKESINSLIDVATNNLEEELHSIIEVSSIKYISSILDEDISFFNTGEGRSDFLYYLCVQYIRTNKIKVNILKNVDGMGKVNIDNTWNILSHVFATNMGWGLMSDKSYNISLLKNESDIEFITGDQPVVNTFATGLLFGSPPEKLEFYYPVSPILAVMISKNYNDSSTKTVCLSKEKVTMYNQHIFEQSHSQVYASKSETLSQYSA